MTSGSPASTALELRHRCAGWPDAVVRRAVLAAFHGSRSVVTSVTAWRWARPLMLDPPPVETDQALATLVANWLTDPNLTTEVIDDPPPLWPDLVVAIWRQLNASIT